MNINRVFTEGWYWIDTTGHNQWIIVRVENGKIYRAGDNVTSSFDDERLNKLIRIKINPPQLET